VNCEASADNARAEQEGGAEGRVLADVAEPRKKNKGEKKMGSEWNRFIDSTAIRVTLIVAGLAVWTAAVAALLSA
jgi:hypothetical protein